MDKKEDRKFYWEVKDFMQNPVVEPKKAQPKIMDAVKSILEQNKVIQQTNFDPKSSITNLTSQAIDSIQKTENKYKSNSGAFSKNDISNPFSVLKEAWYNPMSWLSSTAADWDEFNRSHAKGPPSEKFVKYMKDQAQKNRAQYARTLTPEQLKLTLQAANVVSQEDIASNILDPDLSPEEVEKAGKAFEVISTVPPLAPTPSPVTASGGSMTTPIAGSPSTAKPSTVSAPTSPMGSGSLDDLLDARKTAFGMEIPIYRPARRGQESNYAEWKQATKARNAALRQANIALARERESRKEALNKSSKERSELFKKVREREGIADWKHPDFNEMGPAGTKVQGSFSLKPGTDLESWRKSVLDKMTPEEQKQYMELGSSNEAQRRNLQKIYDATSNEGLANTLRQQSTDRQARWESKTGAFKAKTGQDYDINNPEHQNIMRGLMGFKSLERKPLDTDISSGTAPSGSPKSTIPGVALSGETPDWVRRHAAKFGDESAREIEAMRLGATSVLQGDPTRPMDTSLSAAEVARRGQLLARDRQQYKEQNPLTTSGRQTGVGTSRTASQPESTWDEIARKSVKGDSELANAPLVRRGGKVYAQTANGEIELSTGSMQTSQYAPNAPTREQLNRGSR